MIINFNFSRANVFSWGTPLLIRAIYVLIPPLAAFISFVMLSSMSKPFLLLSHRPLHLRLLLLLHQSSYPYLFVLLFLTILLSPLHLFALFPLHHHLILSHPLLPPFLQILFYHILPHLQSSPPHQLLPLHLPNHLLYLPLPLYLHPLLFLFLLIITP